MRRGRLEELLDAEPFEPFRIYMVNGGFHDVFTPGGTALQRDGVYIAAADQNWVLIPYTSINSVGSLLEDFRFQREEHDAER